MDKKLFVFDFDGTLLDSTGEILPETINALEKINNYGHIATICTGKSLNNLKPYFNQLKNIEIIASCNGCVLNFLKTKIIRPIVKPIDQDAIELIVNLAKQYKREMLFHTYDDKSFRVFFGSQEDLFSIDDPSYNDIESKYHPYDDWNEAQKYLYSNKVVQITLKMEQSRISEPLSIIKKELGNDYNIIVASRIYIDVNPKIANKAYAVKKIQEYFNIDNKHTYCFGDSDNDISMMKYSVNGIGLANGTKLLKYYADWLIGSNDEPSIANYVDQIIKNQNLKQLEPSLLAFDINNIANQLEEVKQLRIECIHYDVMDGFVNNKSFDIEWMDTINKLNLKSTIHLMVYEPIKWIDRFALKKPWAITFQFEANNFSQSIECLNKIKSYGIKAGIAIKPYSRIEDYLPLLHHVDIVTIMTVEPGKGGQKFNDDSIENLINVYKFKNNYNYKLKIQVDGGIKKDNIDKIIKYADYIVSGTGFMELEQADKKQFIKMVKEYKDE